MGDLNAIQGYLNTIGGNHNVAQASGSRNVQMDNNKQVPFDSNKKADDGNKLAVDNNKIRSSEKLHRQP